MRMEASRCCHWRYERRYTVISLGLTIPVGAAGSRESVDGIGRENRAAKGWKLRDFRFWREKSDAQLQVLARVYELNGGHMAGQDNLRIDREIFAAWNTQYVEDSIR